MNLAKAVSTIFISVLLLPLSMQAAEDETQPTEAKGFVIKNFYIGKPLNEFPRLSECEIDDRGIKHCSVSNQGVTIGGAPMEEIYASFSKDNKAVGIVFSFSQEYFSDVKDAVIDKYPSVTCGEILIDQLCTGSRGNEILDLLTTKRGPYLRLTTKEEEDAYDEKKKKAKKDI